MKSEDIKLGQIVVITRGVKYLRPDFKVVAIKNEGKRIECIYYTHQGMQDIAFKPSQISPSTSGIPFPKDRKMRSYKISNRHSGWG